MEGEFIRGHRFLTLMFLTLVADCFQLEHGLLDVEIDHDHGSNWLGFYGSACPRCAPVQALANIDGRQFWTNTKFGGKWPRPKKCL